MSKLLMITGLGSAIDLASGKKGAFYNTLEEFHKYWERIDIICPRINTRGTFAAKVPLVLFGNIFLHISPWPLFLHPLFFIYKILKLHGEINFDLMTVHEFPPFYNGIGARIISILTKIPYVLEIHHIPGYPKAGNIKEKIYRRLMSLFIRFDAKKAKAVRVVNQKETSNFLVKAGVPPEKIIYIPSAYVDLSVFKPMGLSKEYDLIFVGRLEKNKGINLLLEAASKLKIKILNFKIIIVGSGPLENDLKFKIKNLKLQDNVLLYGWAKDSHEIAELMNRSKILVMPSYNEGGPRVVVEALACGVPVLATPVGLVPDLEVAVINIDWDREDIVKKVKLILDNEAEYTKLKQGGLEIAKQFEKKETIKNYADKLKEILG